jgi:protein phosphatase
LCTDGLHGVLDADMLKATMTSAPNVEAAARALVESALDGGGRDNTTALVVRYEGIS